MSVLRNSYKPVAAQAADYWVISVWVATQARTAVGIERTAVGIERYVVTFDRHFRWRSLLNAGREYQPSTW